MCVANVAPQYLICIADDKNRIANSTTWLHNVSNETISRLLLLAKLLNLSTDCVSEKTISKLLVLAKLAFDGTKEDELIFHGRDGALKTLGRVYGLFSLQYCI